MRSAMTNVSIALAILFAGVAGAVPLDGTLKLEGHGRVEFLAVGNPGMLKIRGRQTDDPKNPLKGSLKFSGGQVTGEATYALDALDTGISMRNRHMKEKYLETSKYPEAKLTLTKLSLPKQVQDGDGRAEGISFEGTLALHGKTNPVKGKASIERKDKDVGMVFEYPITLTDYGIKIPSFMSVTVAKDVNITASAEGAVESTQAGR